MKAIRQFSGKTTLLCGVLAAIATFAAQGQTLINLGTQGRNIDFSNAPSTRPEKTGSSFPATCLPGELFFNLGAPAGQNLYGCVATNTWAPLGSGGGSGSGSGLSDPGANGLVVRTAVNTTTAVTAPVGAVVGTTDAQVLTNKSIDGSEVNSGTIGAARMPNFTGDVTTPAGSTATTLATVNSSPGSYGDGSHSVQLTVDGKGRITTIAQVAISGGTGGTGSQFYQTVDQAGTAVTQRPALNFSSTFSVSDNAAATRTEVDLANVNANTGTFGSSTQVPVITVNGKGQITAVSTATPSGASGGGVTPGTLAALPATCTAGALYFATDQPAGQQLYTCSSANTWTQIVSLGTSGALAYTNGSLDVVTSVVPRLTAANTFSGVNSFANGVQLTTTTAGQPACGSSTRGLFWFQSTGTATKDGVQVCVYNGTTFTWISLY